MVMMEWKQLPSPRLVPPSHKTGMAGGDLEDPGASPGRQDLGHATPHTHTFNKLAGFLDYRIPWPSYRWSVVGEWWEWWSAMRASFIPIPSSHLLFSSQVSHSHIA